MSLFPIISPAAALGPVVITQTDESISTPNTTVYTYSSQAIGTASDDRLVVVVTSSDHASSIVSTMTIGGDSMTKWFEVTDPPASFWYRAVSSGTTAEIIVTWTVTVGNNQIGVYAVTGASTTLHDTASGRPGSGTAPTTTIDVAANGGVIGSSFVDYGTYTWNAWVGITKDYDQKSENSNTSAAHDEFTAAETGRTITATPSSLTSNNLAVTVISLAPG